MPLHMANTSNDIYSNLCPGHCFDLVIDGDGDLCKECVKYKRAQKKNMIEINGMFLEMVIEKWSGLSLFSADMADFFYKDTDLCPCGGYLPVVFMKECTLHEGTDCCLYKKNPHMMSVMFMERLNHLLLAGDVILGGDGYPKQCSHDVLILHILHNLVKMLNPLKLPWRCVVGEFASTRAAMVYEQFCKDGQLLMSPEEIFITEYWNVRSMVHVYYGKGPGHGNIQVLKKALEKALNADATLWKEIKSLSVLTKKTKKMRIKYTEMLLGVYQLKEKITTLKYNCSLRCASCRRKKQFASEVSCRFFSYLRIEHPLVNLDELSPMMTTTLGTTDINAIVRAIKHQIGVKSVDQRTVSRFRIFWERNRVWREGEITDEERKIGEFCANVLGFNKRRRVRAIMNAFHRKVCAWCEKKGRLTYRKCGGKKCDILYCSRKHQKKHWLAGHRDTCVKDIV